MRCSEVIHELATPAADRDSSALAAHLAKCESCALWAKRDAQIELLWEATRPESPSAAAWDATWSRVSRSIEPAERVAVGSGRLAVAFRARRFARFGLIVLAQAAAVLLVVSLMWRSEPAPHQVHLAALDRATHLQPASGVQEKLIEIEEGRVVLIRVSSAAQQVVSIASGPAEGGVDDWFVFFNEVEPLASNSVVAMQE